MNSGIKILIAEDDKYLRNAMRVKLEKSGFTVITVGDGQEAIDQIKASIPALVVLDLLMPVKDGFTVLQEIKNDPAAQKIPVIVASNLGQKEDIDKAMHLGAIDYIIKTNMTLGELVEKITKFIPK